MFEHRFTWLKVLVVAYIVEYSLICLTSGKWGVGEDMLMSFLVMTLPGLVIGFLINAFLNFKKPILFYSIGHLIAVVGLILIIWNGHREARVDRASEHQKQNQQFVKNMPGDLSEIAKSKILDAFYAKYPEGEFDFTEMFMDPYKTDQTEVEHTIYIVSTDESSWHEYGTKIVVIGDSLRIVYLLQPSDSYLFQKDIVGFRTALGDSARKRMH